MPVNPAMASTRKTPFNTTNTALIAVSEKEVKSAHFVSIKLLNPIMLKTVHPK
jgi:hypothetical protein